jgi:glutathione S-transferase
MKDPLSRTAYLVGKRLTIVDIALHGYSHIADEPGLNLAVCPAIKNN